MPGLNILILVGSSSVWLVQVYSIKKEKHDYKRTASRKSVLNFIEGIFAKDPVRRCLLGPSILMVLLPSKSLC